MTFYLDLLIKNLIARTNIYLKELLDNVIRSASLWYPENDQLIYKKS